MQLSILDGFDSRLAELSVALQPLTEYTIRMELVHSST